ncbi:MAG: hypothetical protein IJ568_02525 [Bacilli bacterium]|nr:hypothetical protein [Bacilli bacterium]
MDNKLNNMLNDFFKENEYLTDEELDAKLKDFVRNLNNNEIKYQDTPLDEAYEILKKARNAKTKKQAIKLANEAFEKSNACFDAIIFLSELEDDQTKKLEILNDGLEKEKERLEQEGFFDKKKIGSFYSIFETRPYITGLGTKAALLTSFGQIRQAIDICKEVLKLNSNDNTGIRYLLMSIYAYLEDEKELTKLYNKYKEENIRALFPMLVLYYKLGNFEKAKEYLNLLNKNNKHFVKFFKGTLEPNKDLMSGYYSIGDETEVVVSMVDNIFLLDSVSQIDKFIIENSKK